MKSKTVSPRAARTLCRLLKKAGYSEESPFVLENPVRLIQVIDLPGVLDFSEPLVSAVWPDRDSVSAVDESRTSFRILDSYDDYGQGNYIDAYWGEGEMQSLVGEFYRCHPHLAGVR